MALGSGSRLGPYEIQAPLGAGGMGEVYRARDTRLDRTVAIKVLPEGLAADAEFRDRFDREARVISQLAHPHICTLFDVGRQASTDYLVLEYLEGETLAIRIARGALKPDDTLRIATEIAEALDAAHGAGIVHRDLKPGNVMLTKGSGGSTAQAKLLDFGLAKSSRSATGAPRGHMDLTAPPTMTSPLTTQGTILGTFQYMAPEQIEGREADARSDIWAFGCIVYEMLTGKKAFEGKTQAGLIGAILERDPASLLDITASVPRRLAWVLSVCLAKDPDERWQHVRDVLHELRRLRESEDRPAPPAAAKRAIGPLVVTGAVAVVAIVALTAVLMTRREAATLAMRFVVLPAEGTEVTPGPAAPQAAISPDGTRIVFSAVDESQKAHLFMRALDSLEAQTIAGIEDGELPFWSADGRFVGFFTGDRKLKKVAVAGGPAQTVCDLPGAGPWGGGAWNEAGVILFGAGPNHPIYRVPAAGGVAPEPVTTLDRTHRVRAHVWPAFVDGQHFLFLVTGSDPAVRGIYLGTLGSTQTTRLVETTTRAAFAPPGYMLFVRDGTLLAQSLDLKAPRLIGEPRAVAEHLAYNPDVTLGRSTFTTSNTGVLVYRTGDVGGIQTAQLTWFDRKGRVLGTVGPPALNQAFDITRDGSRVAVGVYDRRSRQSDIWMMDVVRDSRARMTFDPAGDNAPTWSPQGDGFVFSSERRGTMNLYMKTGNAPETLLFESPSELTVEDWSSDGRLVIYSAADLKTGADVWLLPLTGDRKPRPLIQTGADEWQTQLSPDQRWLAYTSNESGANEVYVQPFPPSGAKWQISRDGGTGARWRGDGKELYYVSADRKLMAVEVKTGAAFESSAPVELFRVGRPSLDRNDYVAARDGQRFLVNSMQQQTGTSITVVIDWLERLK